MLGGQPRGTRHQQHAGAGRPGRPGRAAGRQPGREDGEGKSGHPKRPGRTARRQRREPPPERASRSDTAAGTDKPEPTPRNHPGPGAPHRNRGGPAGGDPTTARSEPPPQTSGTGRPRQTRTATAGSGGTTAPGRNHPTGPPDSGPNAAPQKPPEQTRNSAREQPRHTPKRPDQTRETGPKTDPTRPPATGPPTRPDPAQGGDPPPRVFLRGGGERSGPCRRGGRGGTHVPEVTERKDQRKKTSERNEETPTR